ncbi:MAG: hypothetical protein IT462_16200 [Planctomycetes bacterium]|nr:hypothetical protein [Planctomycetota bacterium]
MSHKKYRTPANPPVAQRAVEAALSAKSAFETKNDPQILAQLKHYLSSLVDVAQDSLEGADTLVSPREGIAAARALLSVMKHEQRLKERAEKADAAQAAPAKAAPRLPAVKPNPEFEAFLRDMAQKLGKPDAAAAVQSATAPPQAVAA